MVGSSILSVGTISSSEQARLTLQTEPNPILTGSQLMRVREDNRNMVLLASVVLLCALIALAAAAFDPMPSTAGTAHQQTALADQEAVRVVGVPFVPNTNPRERR